MHFVIKGRMEPGGWTMLDPSTSAGDCRGKPVIVHNFPQFHLLGGTYGRIFDFSFGGRTENRYELALEFVFGADSKCVLHHFPSLACFKGSWGHIWPESGRKPELKSTS